MVALSMALVAGISRCGDNVWELGEVATSAAGAPLGVLCLFLPFSFGGSAAALAGACAAQCVFVALKWDGSDSDSEASEGMPFVWAVVIGTASYAAVALCGGKHSAKAGSKED